MRLDLVVVEVRKSEGKKTFAFLRLFKIIIHSIIYLYDEVAYEERNEEKWFY